MSGKEQETETPERNALQAMCIVAVFGLGAGAVLGVLLAKLLGALR